MTYIFYAILLYLLYRFIVGFLIPVVRTTSQVKKQFNAMKEKMEEAQGGGQQRAHAYDNQGSNGNNGRTTINAVNQKPKYDIEGEYISFEENPK